MHRLLLLLLLAWGAPALAQDNDQQIADAAAEFGARPGIEDIDISPDGRHVAYLTPGPGPSTILLVETLGSQDPPRQILRVGGDPERLRWCSFVTDSRLICRISALVSNGNVLVPFARLISFGIDGGDAKMLGERASLYDTQFRQNDGLVTACGRPSRRRFVVTQPGRRYIKVCCLSAPSKRKICVARPGGQGQRVLDRELEQSAFSTPRA